MNMTQRSLWCCLFLKPAFSFFHPLSSVSTIVTKATMKGNILLQNLVIPSYYDGILSIRRGTTNDDQSSSFSLMQQGGVTFLPFLSSILNFIAQQRICIALCYILLANTIYLQRRSYLRKMTKRKLLKIRTTREEGVGIPMYIINIAVWQLFVTIIFPILEPLARIFNYVCFYYFYPNADGFGFIFEPLSVQHLPMPKRQRSQIRLDWHRFSMNKGNVGRDGFRHPPSVVRNLPHIDAPKMNLKHWPWRRQHKVMS